MPPKRTPVKNMDGGGSNSAAASNDDAVEEFDALVHMRGSAKAKLTCVKHMMDQIVEEEITLPQVKVHQKKVEAAYKEFSDYHERIMAVCPPRKGQDQDFVSFFSQFLDSSKRTPVFDMAQHQLNFLRTWCLVSALFHVLTTCSELDDAIELFAQTLGSSEPEDNNPALPVKVPDLTESDAEEILDQLGFDAIANTRGPGEIRNKLSQFQKLYGLQESGELCNSTKILLKIPRCGVSDVAALGEDFKWDKSFLTYYVRNFPMNVASSSVRQLLQNAFNQWSAVTNLDFIESENHDADIEIIFGGRVHPHRWESCATELGSGILAHAFFPTTGAIHFNTQFFFGSRNEDDFFNTAMHEIGHALGLDHSVNPASIMYPTLVARYSEIPQIDAEKIQLKYGKRDHRSTTYIPKFCNLDKYDAVLYDNSGKLSFVSGKYLYSSMTSDKPPISLGEQWPGAPDRLDTAVTMGSHTYLFRDDQVWAFVADKLELGYPRPIRRTFPGLPRHLDAIVHFGSKYLFGFKNEHFWRYNVAQKMVDHSGEVRDFGVPGQIDAAVYDEQRNEIIFFKKDLRYVYNCDTLKTTADYSRMDGC